ncbi:hypothetical protein Hanom_Chr06g00497161 [Helianthus anomalus]
MVDETDLFRRLHSCFVDMGLGSKQLRPKSCFVHLVSPDLVILFSAQGLALNLRVSNL